ncbi:MAG TPA: HisA/HisF-related TIM barrel protein [Gaiellaceae bacterium]|nr:HisA/HisF-related TIM barrel protein [Gaiellaceae bacterium]
MIEVIPAIDVASGRVAQSGGDPLATALDWQARGATRLHLVDLDLAYGRGENHELIGEVISRLAIPVQLSGGIASDGPLEFALSTRAERIVLALADPDWVASVVAHSAKGMAVALDVRGDDVRPRGTRASVGKLDELLPRIGARRYVVTDVERDGALSGPNLELLRRVRSATDAALVASGGISSPEDLEALAGVAEAAIVGTALYSGAVSLLNRDL